MASELNALESVVQHRRDIARKLYIPAVAIGLGIILFVLALVIPASPIGLSSRSQVAIVSNIFLICFALCPLVLCLFPLYVVLMAATFGLQKSHNGTARGLRRIQRVTQTMKERVSSLGDTLSRKSIGIGTRLAFVDQWLKGANHRKLHKGDEQNDGSK